MESGQGMSTVAEQLQENSDVSQVVSDNGNNATSSVNPVYTESCNVSASVNTPSNDHTSSDERKLFVGGMHWETGEKELREHFGQFGEIEHIKLKSDRPTGCSRGFAFIVFKSDEAIHKVEAVSDHVINGKKVDPKRARARQSKIYVGSLTPEINDEDIKSHFAQFGTIVEAQMPYDTVKNQRKGFCFIIYETEETVKKVLKMPKQIINGKEITVKRAVPKPSIPSPICSISGQMREVHGARGGHGGAIGGRGGFGVPGFNIGYGGVQGGRGGFVAATFDSGYGRVLGGMGNFGAPGYNSGVRGARGGFGAPGFNSGHGGVRGGRGAFGAPGFNSGYGGVRGGRGGFIHDNWQSYDSSHSYAQNINLRGASFGGYRQRYQPY